MTQIAIIAIWCVLDVIVNTAMESQTDVYASANASSNATVTSSAIDVRITSTTIDLCFLSWVRLCIMATWIMTLSRCYAVTALKEAVLFHASLMLLMVISMYDGVKLLLLYEHEEFISDRPRQIILGWTCFASVVDFLLLSWSRKNEVISAFKKESGTSDEKFPLLGKKGDQDNSKPSTSLKNTSNWRFLVYQYLVMSVPDAPFIVCGACFLLCTVACEILVPRYTGRIIDSLVVNPSKHAFPGAIVRLTVVALCLAISAWLQILMMSMYVARWTARLRRIFFTVVISQDVDFFDEHDTGDLVTNLMANVAVMGVSFSPYLDQCLKGFFGLIGIMICMATISWKLSLVALISFPVFVANSYAYGYMMKGVGHSGQAIMTEMGDHADECFSNIRTVRSFAMESTEAELFAASVKRLFAVGKREAWVHSTFQPIALLVQISLQVCMLLYGGHLVHRHVMSGGDLVTFVMYLSMINTCVQVINATYGNVAKGIGASHTVFQHITRKPIYTGKGTLVKRHARGEIEFKDVCFSYRSRPQQLVLKNLSFRVSPGEVVALVGPSGGGKSTCVSLLLNFYQPSSGHVLLDGVPVSHYDHCCLHSKMALVGQEPALFSRSIRDNITYGHICPWSEDDVISSARLANAHGFISALPSGYDTNAGGKGLQMSGGQKQRVAIARALIRQPAVLLLDEATSALDSHSEAKVQEALNSSAEGRTVIIIAHRLSTVEKADRVLVIQKGQVVEEGPPSDLLNRKDGVFASLAQHQLIRADSASALPFGQQDFPLDDVGTGSTDNSTDDVDDEACFDDNSSMGLNLILSLGSAEVAPETGC